MLKVPEGTDKTFPENYPEIWVFYEFLYFFMHMTMRHACKDSALTGNSLFSKLARSVAELSGNSMNPATFVFIISAAVDAYKSMNLDSLLREAGKVL